MKKVKKIFGGVVSRLFMFLRELSLDVALRQQRLDALAVRLSNIVKDISNQYTGVVLTDSLQLKCTRYLHAFQISLVNDILPELENPLIIDIGDSAGTHILYIKSIYRDKRIKAISVNLDKMAVERIKKLGLEALVCRAEDLPNLGIKPDVFLCFEVLEHMSDPVRFLHSLSTVGAKYIIITVPFVRRSRVGFQHIRTKTRKMATAENMHIFELCPEDWKLLMMHSGWKVVKEKIYLQEPRWHPLYFTSILWRKYDFEGYYGVILRPDFEWERLYRDW